MLVPVVRKIKNNEKLLVERVFPVEGDWGVELVEFVEPFSRLGACRFSQNTLNLPKDFKPNNMKSTRKLYYSGSLLGKSKREKIVAPYDGYLIQVDKKFIFEENERNYLLLSGVWGTVKSLYEKKSALIESQSKDILFCASTGESTSGELVVFPNPSDVLKRSYLENFVKGVKGKVIYIGHFVGTDVVKRAYELGASAVLSGSCHSETFDFAKSHNFAFGIFSGFGNIKTPEDIYKYLSSVSFRYVFFEGEKSILRVPVRVEDIQVSADKKVKKVIEPEDLGYIKDIEAGMKVQVLQNPYFGWIGVVDRVAESSIFVKFGLDDRSVEVRLPNFLIVE